VSGTRTGNPNPITQAERDEIFMMRWGNLTGPETTDQKPLVGLCRIYNKLNRSPYTVQSVLAGDWDRKQAGPKMPGFVGFVAERIKSGELRL